MADRTDDKSALWIVRLASDSSEADGWERAMDSIILRMSRRGSLVGDEPERLGFLVRRGVHLMRSGNESDNGKADRAGAGESIPLPPSEDRQPEGQARPRGGPAEVPT